ncbi:MAG TPA: SH3 domain-containing protein, partial [Xanthomonadaceae bacterium]|nr:SH3 domain-containing protein [Xanthomonadaceae bacterium]
MTQADANQQVPGKVVRMHRFPTLSSLLVGLISVAVLASPTVSARDTLLPVPAHGVIGVDDAKLSPGYWVSRLETPDAVLLEPDAIAARNARLLQADDSMHDLAAWPVEIDGQVVRALIEDLSSRPTRTLYDVHGREIPAATLDDLVSNLALDALSSGPRTVRFGLVLKRAPLRTFPTDLRVFSRPGETDIDRFQESALFPGTPVLMLRQSNDTHWEFVVSPRYAAWIPRTSVAIGTREQVLGYGSRTPYRVITGAEVHTVDTREAPQVSALQLDMGVRVPLAEVPLDQPVNGQHPYTSWIVDLPVFGPDDFLAFQPALLPKIADTSPDYLPLTRANLIRQAFKFLGERYGWGHSYDGRDCSGFVSEVYRSMGVQLPRNTSDQAVSPVFARRAFGEADTSEARLAAARALDVGDLVYIPGHVMMVIGHVDGQPYVIHDTNGGSYVDADGELVRMGLNGVVVTPLLPMAFNETETYVDRMTAIVSP